MELTLVILAAGISSRYGGLKQLEAVGPGGEALLDYAVYDAVRAGFSKIVFVIRPELRNAFREHARRQYGSSVTVAYVHQELNNLPPPFSAPPNREKPWGTGHALLTAGQVVTEPFAVCNADDFYGASSYRLLFDHLTGTAPARDPLFALVGYPLRATLSESGGVSRGICTVHSGGLLEQLVEVTQIKKEEKGQITGTADSGDRYVLTGDETVSTSLWALSPSIFPTLEAQFARFLREHGADPEAEFLMPTALNEQIASGEARVKVLPAQDQWLGITFPDDRAGVVEKIRKLIERGDYPADLSAGFARG